MIQKLLFIPFIPYLDNGLHTKMSIQLYVPLEEVLPNITLVVSEREDTIEITVGSTYTDEIIPTNPVGEIDHIHCFSSNVRLKGINISL